MAIPFSRVTLGPLARRGGRQAHNPVEWRKSKCCPASLISVSYFQYFQSTSTRVIKIYLLADPWPGPVTDSWGLVRDLRRHLAEREPNDDNVDQQLTLSSRETATANEWRSMIWS